MFKFSFPYKSNPYESIVILFLILSQAFYSTNVLLMDKFPSDNNDFESKTDSIESDTLNDMRIIEDLIVFPQDASSADIIINITKNGEYLDGYNMFVLEKRFAANTSVIGHYLLIIDMDGNVIRNRTLNTSASVDNYSAKFINSTTILYGDGNDKGPVLWNLESNESIQFDFIGHHEYEYNPINNSIFTFKSNYRLINGTSYRYDYIREYNFTGDIIWERTTHDFIPTSTWCPYLDMSAGARDITHSNTIYFDSDNDTIYYLPRNTNTFYKINHSNGEVLWGLGEYGNFTLFDRKGVQKNNLFYHPHSVEPIDNNTFIIFDNDYHNQTNQFNQKSRMIEITINETTKTANITWVWEGSERYYSKYWGDADRLPNGNRLGTFGMFEHPNSDIGARLIEANNAGDIVWELNFPHTEDYIYGVYRMERFSFSPIVEDIPNIITTKYENVNVIWKTWYNFRTRNNTIGLFQVYLNDVLIDSGTHTLQKYWHATNFSINLGTLSNGYYNLTLAVADEAGHVSTDYVNVTVTDFYIERNGPEVIEKGQDNSILYWDGVTISAMDYNITVNGTIEQSGVWNGGKIEYDLNSLSFGTHLVVLNVLNNSIPKYYDSLYVYIIYISPVISLYPTDQTIIWNQSLLLTWELFDHSPLKYEIYINGSLFYQNSWIVQNYTLNWELPILDEGIYNITLKAYDQFGQINDVETWLTINSPSPPIIVSWPLDYLIWDEDIILTWEVHGGNSYVLWKNNSILQSGTKTAKIEYTIDNWRNFEWFPALYNITLFVSDEYNNYSSITTFIDVILFVGDPYIDSIVDDQSIFYSNGENIIDAPDSSFASIYSDYSNGYITGDMGSQEEILDGSGDDFEVIAYGGQYRIWVNNNLSTPFVFLASASGNTTFDLASIDFSKARYIRIEYMSGGIVNVDAINATYFNQPKVDTAPPEIIGPVDFTIYNNQTSTILNWTVYDKTPYNFTISVNNIIVASDFWNGSDIQYEFFIEEPGIYNVTLTLFDIFGNSANDTVKVIIVSSNLLSKGAIIALSISGSVVVLTSLVLFTRFIIKKKKQTDM